MTTADDVAMAAAQHADGAGEAPRGGSDGNAGADAARRPHWGAVALRLGVAAGAALFLGALKIHRPPELATVCVLRATTGVPCPLCGGTTAFVRLGQGRVADALLANPVVLLVALGLVLAPTGVFGALRRAPQRVMWGVIGVVTGASWLWQLARYDLL